MYRFETFIKLHDTDASGLIYFAHQLRIAHEAFEHFLVDKGHKIGDIIVNRDFILPIVHAEADYRAPLRTGDALTIEVSTKRIGTTSLTLAYRFLKNGKDETGSVETVHVAVDHNTGKKIALPSELREVLAALGE